MKIINNKEMDDKYKDQNSKYHNSNESVTNKNPEEIPFIETLMSITFPLKVVNCVIGTISSCGVNIIELEKISFQNTKQKYMGVN